MERECGFGTTAGLCRVDTPELLQPAVVSGRKALPNGEATYLGQVAKTLQRHLESRLVGVYLFGSAAYSAYEPGISDLDVQAVVSGSLSKREREEIAVYWLTRRSHARQDDWSLFAMLFHRSVQRPVIRGSS